MVTFIKNNILVIITLSVGLVAFLLSCKLVYQMGYFTDLNSDVKIETIFIIGWIALFGSFTITVISFIILLKYRTKKLLAYILLSVLVAILGLFIGSELTFHEAYSDRPFSDKELVNANPYFYNIDLDELKDLFSVGSGYNGMIYVARNDCAECISFETKISDSLRRNSYGLPTYSTNRDRDGSRKDELNESLI